MKTAGIICEYNPLHLGHRKQFDRIRELLGPDTRIVCAMSGNYVQRGAPALLDKSLRAEAAVRCGADLVIELPLTASLSSAEGFARAGVSMLSTLCDTLCFGAETDDPQLFRQAAQVLCSEAFSQALRRELDTGKSFPAARQKALEALGMPALTAPNDLLAAEYCKAVYTLGAHLELLPIHRPGNYHAEAADPDNPSATAVRRLMCSGEDWTSYVPREAASLFRAASLHTLQTGQLAVLSRLRSMTQEEFAALPYGSEGLWRKLMHQCRRGNTLEEILTAVKSKRYTRTRLDRMVLCAFLGISQELLQAPVPYARILAFNDRGRKILRECAGQSRLLNAGAPAQGPYWELERRAGDLYGLFQVNGPEGAGAEAARRVRYVPQAIQQKEVL